MFVVKKTFFLFSIILFISLGETNVGSTWAAESSQIKREPQNREVIITSGVLAEEKEDYRPDEKYTDQDGKEFWLKKWQIEPIQMPERREWTEQEIVYEEVEWEGQIPKQAPLIIKDKVTGQTLKQNFSIIHMEQDKQQWVPGFSFTAVFHSFDADYYQLGSKKIPFDNKKPQIKDCYQELLNEIQVDPEDYRINDATWEGEAYVDDSGTVCRNALVTGEKRVSDYRVIYGGEAVIPSFQGFQCVSVYQGFDSVTDGWDQAGEHLVESEKNTGSDNKGSWVIFRRSVVVTFSILLVIGAIVFSTSVMQRNKRKKRSKEIEDEEIF
ncbi:hypothetical protein [Lacrimispora algidixylanolytica]|uniref:Uncharacterized protein n=1 Tax=Lacrimispora algidixylanolytica TaxID=94868 RepID=A0A419T3P2_9FIRM|nr:hypothetical protein [Lacrimispora algidixylanolytica]RKD32046.1 hypothetical protein BET01_18730 [Lacrimispora algidixylanolytica]